MKEDSGSYPREVTIQIQNTSASSLYISYVMLSGGMWSPDNIPIPAQTILPGGALTFQNVATSAFSALGGGLTLSAAAGGQINIGWNWPSPPGTLIQSSFSSSTTLSASSWVVNPQTNSPGMILVISPSN